MKNKAKIIILKDELDLTTSLITDIVGSWTVLSGP